MATYKVIQDIEADDKLVGPLSLKQFVFAVVAAGFAFIAFKIATATTLFAVIPFLPFILVPAVLAAPLGRDQPTDLWLAAQIRFLIKPRKRIWDQSGIKELVNITVPKREEKVYTDGLSQTEVRSRLQALANTLDSRGWAAKNVDVNMYATPAFAGAGADRLIDPSSLPQAVNEAYVSAADDMMDATNNPVAQNFSTMVQQAADQQRAAAIARMQSAMQQQPTAQPSSSVANDADETRDSFLKKNNQPQTEQEEELLKHIKQEKSKNQPTVPHHKVIKTLEEQQKEEAEKKKLEAEAKKQAQAVTTPKNPGIVDLANTNDLSVESLSHLANRKPQKTNDGEVVIKLR